MVLDEEDRRAAIKNATYPEIKEYIKNKHGINVHTAYIALIKREYGLTCREAFNKPEQSKREYHCTDEKRKMIIEALQYFKMIS
ncbi:23S rRNA methyltransferase [Lacrimispora sp. BS-2]|uniref:23S rRNA methyltransferase n=1 Tax=Lacrimispora sp. BS-2 TaxID=3151850 RepID=A0AAU7PR92_9FIRM